MPRKPRAFEDGGIYHVYNRGNNRMAFLQDREDFGAFYRCWLKGKDKYPCDIFHYCFMNNHYHVLLRMKEGREMAKLLHHVQLGYVRYFKLKYEYMGRVFQERYRSPKIEEESYYLQCGRYIERNPVEAGMAAYCDAYAHSSARYYSYGEKNRLITENLYYREMGKTDESRREAYRKFVAMPEPYASLFDKLLLIAP